jgi:hypothetical protein
MKKDTQPVDYITEGFLNDDYYQFIVKKSPEKYAKGILEKRESAYLEAKNSAAKTALESLTRYCYSLYLSKHPGPKNAGIKAKTGKFKQKLLSFTDRSYLYQEYYTSIAEAVLVFRIHKNGLKSDIDSLALSPE